MTDAGIVMMVTHNLGLVILSVAIAIVASYTALNFVTRPIVTQGRVHKLWLVGGAIAIGIGIWSMHLLAMLAYKLPAPAYDFPIILVSIAVAVITSGTALFVFQGEQCLLAVSRDITDHKQAEEALRKSEEHLRQVVQNMPVMMDALDTEGNIIVWNRECELVTGYSASELVGNPKAIELLYPDVAYRTQMMTEWAKRGSDYRDWEWNITAKDGSVKTISWSSISKLFPIEGWATWGIGVAVTARKQAEEALRVAHQRLMYHVENSPLAAIEWDQNLRMLWLSPQAEKVFGWRAEEVFGKHMFDDWSFIYAEDKETVRRDVIGPLMSGREQRNVSRNRNYTKNGSVVYCEWYNSVLLDGSGELVSVMALAMDITKRQRAEEALQKAYDELEIKVEERTTELRNANEQLQSEIVERKRAEEALRESNQQIINILERITDAFVALDDQWQFTYLNPQAEKLLQRKREELLGKNVWEEYPEIVDQPFYRECHKVVSQQVALTVEEFFPPLNIWFEVHAYPSEDGLTAYFNNITERKWEEKQVRLLQNIMQAIAEAPDFHSALSVALGEVCETTGWSFGEAWFPRFDGTALECSPAWYGSDFGAIRESPLQKFRTLSEAFTFPLGSGLPGRVWESLQPEWIPDVSAQPENIFLRALIAQECGLKAGLGVPIIDNEQVLAVLVFFTFELREEEQRLVELVWAVATELGSVIQRKRVEEEIKKLNEDLKCRTVELEAANKDLEAFSYSVSHDLRAPLRALNGFTRILQKDYAPTIALEAQRYLQMVQDNAQQMGNLVDDLLAFSRLGRSALKKQLVHPDELVRAAIAALRHEQENRQVEIMIGDLPVCQADSALLKQIWVNLLSNALKFTRNTEVARITVGYQQIDSDRVYFVKDNGVGFDMQYAHKLFGVFQRLHRAEEYEGTGVGLAIVQRIIHRHSGRVWVEAEVNKGATFYFTLEGDIHYYREDGRNPVSGRPTQ